MKRVGWLAGVVVVATTGWTGGAAAQGGSAQPAPRDGGSYEVHLRDLQERVEQIKEQVRRMQIRDKLLADSMPSGLVAGTPVEIDLRDRTTGAFVVTGVRVWIDDQLVYDRSDEQGALGSLRAVMAYSGVAPAGEHTARVVVRLAGNGAVLPYMRAYHFEVTDERRFVAIEGRPTTVTIGAYERGGVTTPFELRPAISWETR
jgi:hypothetical protein